VPVSKRRACLILYFDLVIPQHGEEYTPVRETCQQQKNICQNVFTWYHLDMKNEYINTKIDPKYKRLVKLEAARRGEKIQDVVQRIIAEHFGKK